MFTCKSIQLRIALWTSVCLLVSGVVVVAYAVIIARSSSFKTANEHAFSEARVQAEIVRANIEVSLDTTRTLAQALRAVKVPQNRLVISREQVNAMMKQVLIENPQFLGIWTLWEPNAFDGEDAYYTNTKAYGKSGRYQPYYHRGLGEITVEAPSTDSGDWYQIPKKTQQEYITDLYTYQVAGKDTLMVTVVVPIVVSQVFYGVMGVDLSVDFLQDVADKVNIYNNTGTLFLVGNNGKVIAATGQPPLREKLLSEFMNHETNAAFEDTINTGKENSFFTKDYLVVTVSIHFGQVANRWAAVIFVPAEAIVAPVNTLMWQLIGIYIVMSFVGVGALWIVAREIAKPIKMIAAVTRKVAAGDLDQRVMLGTRYDELGLLANDFNLMTMQLRKTYHNLLASERRFSTLFNQAADAIFVLNLEGRFLEANRMAAESLGYTREELLGMNVADVDAEFISHDHIKNFWGKLESDRPVTLEGKHQRKDGTIFPVEVRIGLLRDEDHTVLLALVRDITERKKAEEERIVLQNRLQQSQKMEAVGTLAGGIAHDFNNILGVILGYTELAKNDAPPGSQFERKLEQVLAATNRAKDLVKRILAFSHQSEIERVPLEIQPLVQEALMMLRSSIPTTINILEDIDPESCIILADPIQIHQIIMNLCTNAYHAMEETGGVLSVNLSPFYVSTDDQCNRLHLPPGEYILLRVNDTGSGIEPDIINRIFEPYFTTKELGKGTGMGLAIIHGIISEYGGKITVESQLGKGTTFHIYLPVVKIEDIPDTIVNDEPLKGNERILLVDDEKKLAEVGRSILEGLGYHVTVRFGSLKALATFQDTPDDFDMIITDQTMPDMTGSDLAQRMLQIRPDVPIILSTGYSNLIDEKSAKAMGIKGFAKKPLTIAGLARLIRKVLDIS